MTNRTPINTAATGLPLDVTTDERIVPLLSDGFAAKVQYVAEIDGTPDSPNLSVIDPTGAKRVGLLDGGHVAFGATTDPTWGGVLAGTAMSIYRYIGTKLEAIRVLLAGTISVSGAFFQATQPVSVAALPLPANAATQATLAAVLAGVIDTTPIGVTSGAASQADGHSVTLGAKGDTAWDGAALSPTSQGIWKYIGTKLEAVRALLAGTLAVSGTFFQATQPTSTIDGGNTTFGAQANPAWDGVTGSATAIAIFKAIWAKLAQMYVAMTDVTAVSIVNRRRDITGRQVTYVCSFVTSVITDTICATFTKYTDGVASGAGALTSLTVPAGYRYALASWSLGGTNNAGMTTAAQLRASLRHANQGVAGLASPFIDQIGVNTGPVANNLISPVRATFAEPIDFIAGDSLAVSLQLTVWNAATTNPILTVILNGREYLNP